MALEVASEKLRSERVHSERLGGRQGKDGLARALRPAHTITDGDTVFALSTGAGEPLTGRDQRAVQIVAADCLSRAIAHGVLAASDRPDARSYRALFPSAIR